MSSPYLSVAARGEGPHLRVEVWARRALRRRREWQPSSAQDARLRIVRRLVHASWNFCGPTCASRRTRPPRSADSSLRVGVPHVTAGRRGSHAGRKSQYLEPPAAKHARAASPTAPPPLQRRSAHLRSDTPSPIKDAGPAGEERLRQVRVLHRALSINRLISEEAKANDPRPARLPPIGRCTQYHAANAAMDDLRGLCGPYTSLPR